MSNLIESAPEEPGNGPVGSNRAFVLIALGLASLLVLGLLLLFGYVAGSRLGLIGPRALASPDVTGVVTGPVGSDTAIALAGSSLVPPGTALPAAATSTSAAATAVAAGTRVPGATLPAPASPGTRVADAAATLSVATPTPTRVVGGSVNTPSAVATTFSSSAGVTTPPAVNTPALGAVLPTRTPGGAVSSGTGDATPTPSGPASGSSLPGTGVELDILALGILMLILLVIARGFRLALRF